MKVLDAFCEQKRGEFLPWSGQVCIVALKWPLKEKEKKRSLVLKLRSTRFLHNLSFRSMKKLEIAS